MPDDRISRYLDRADDLLNEACMQPDSEKARNLTTMAEAYINAASVVGEHMSV